MKAILVAVAMLLAGCVDGVVHTEFIPASSIVDGAVMLDGVEYLLQITVEVRCSDSAPVGSCVLTNDHRQICRWADCIDGAWVTPSMTFQIESDSKGYETVKHPNEIRLSGNMTHLRGVTMITFE